MPTSASLSTSASPNAVRPPPSPRISALDLEAYGLRWRHAPAVLGHPWPDGSWTILHPDAAVTAALLGR